MPTIDSWLASWFLLLFFRHYNCLSFPFQKRFWGYFWIIWFKLLIFHPIVFSSGLLDIWLPAKQWHGTLLPHVSLWLLLNMRSKRDAGFVVGAYLLLVFDSRSWIVGFPFLKKLLFLCVLLFLRCSLSILFLCSWLRSVPSFLIRERPHRWSFVRIFAHSLFNHFLKVIASPFLIWANLLIIRIQARPEGRRAHTVIVVLLQPKWNLTSFRLELFGFLLAPDWHVVDIH